jgi:hypothetical protein
MTVWNGLWSFGIFFPFWYVWTKKNLATLPQSKLTWSASLPVLIAQLGISVQGDQMRS